MTAQESIAVYVYITTTSITDNLTKVVLLLKTNNQNKNITKVEDKWFNMLFTILQVASAMQAKVQLILIN